MIIMIIIQFTFRKYQKQHKLWEDFYADSNNYAKETLIMKDEPSKYYSGTKSLYVTQSFFYKTTSSSSGGSIFFSSTADSKMLIDYSIFIQCSCSNFGGAIAMYWSGQSVVQFCCSESCIISGNAHIGGHFIHVDFRDSNTITTKNYVYDTSVIRSKSDVGRATILLEHSTIQCKRVNVSQNHINDNTGIYCQYPFTTNDPENPDSYLFQCSLNQNNASSQTIIFFEQDGSDGFYKIEQCNIINNQQPENAANGIIYSEGKLVISNSCIKENIGSPSISTTSQAILYDCTISNLTTSENVILENAKEHFINSISVYATGNCFSYPDFVPGNTPHIRTCDKQGHHQGCFVPLLTHFIELPKN